jgi:hypothetical protein
MAQPPPPPETRPVRGDEPAARCGQTSCRPRARNLCQHRAGPARQPMHNSSFPPSSGLAVASGRDLNHPPPVSPGCSLCRRRPGRPAPPAGLWRGGARWAGSSAALGPPFVVVVAVPGPFRLLRAARGSGRERGAGLCAGNARVWWRGVEALRVHWVKEAHAAVRVRVLRRGR